MSILCGCSARTRALPRHNSDELHKSSVKVTNDHQVKPRSTGFNSSEFENKQNAKVKSLLS